MDGSDPAKQQFDPTLSDRERACFEAGIKLGAIFHSLLAIPVQNQDDVLKSVEDGFTSAFKSQPYVEDLKIKIKIDDPEKYTKRNPYDYMIIKDYMLDVELSLKYGDASLEACIKWLPELEYPLMAVSRID
jgi:hypothetical protein